MQAVHVLIVGGGIGGLTAALALRQHGFAADVFEAASGLAEVGAGVTIAPNAMRGFAYLGLAEQIEAAGIVPVRQQVRHWRDGRVLLTLERGLLMRELYGAPYVYLYRPDLQAILVEALRRAGGTLHLGAAVRAARADDGGAGLELADGRSMTGDLIVGADGIKSVVRRLYEPEQAHFTGHVAWRGVVPAEGELAHLAANPGNFIGPDRLAVHYPMRGGALLNMVFFGRQDGWHEDGWTIPARRDELEALFAGWCGPVQAMIAAVREGELFRWAINARSALPRWSIGDRITLLGDAAHAMTPFLGQGASTAIEDGIILARALAAAATRGEALARYEAARIARTGMIQAESNANADRMQGEDSELFGMKKLRNEETLGLFAYDCGAVPI